MDTSRISEKLTEIFKQESRIIFWYDPDGEFEESLEELTLPDVSLLRLDQEPALGIKMRVEQEEPNRHFLLYSPAEKPDLESDWLLDIFLYSREFRADRASILLSELGLATQSLRAHLAKRGKFFASKDRMSRVKKLITAEDSALDIDRKIIAALVRCDQADLFQILLTLFNAIPEGNPDLLPLFWKDLEKYDVEESFWSLIKQSFGYEEDSPSLKNLLIRLMITDFGQSIGGALPNELKHLVLSRNNMANAVVCLAQWRDSSKRSALYDRISTHIGELIKLDAHLDSYDIDALSQVETFLLCEKALLRLLRNRILSTQHAINVSEIHEISRIHRDSYWARDSLPSTQQAPRTALNAVYRALDEAAEFFALLNEFTNGFSFGDAAAAVEAYTNKLFRFDLHYRCFGESADQAEAQNWDLLKSLRTSVEDAYLNGYLAKLAHAWNQQLEAGLLETWKVPGTLNQHNFFQQEVQPVLEKSADRRVFVVISDAFRYEAAHELAGELNGRYRMTADLGIQLSVLPSYTGLGMAALLPHQELAYNTKGSIEVDGLPCSSLEQRGKILNSVNGVAIKAGDFMAMNKTQGREFIKPYRVVYVYHNTIDAIGDSHSTESHTFDAVRKAIGEVGDLTVKIINNLNGHHVIITADHGFLFQESPLTETEKNTLGEKPTGTLLAKKRYLLGRDLPEHEKAFRGSTYSTATASGDMDFWIPKGLNRFHFVGGSRFVHGGAMPQEVIVPVIRVRHQRGKNAKCTKTRTIGISVLGSKFKITTNRHRFRLIQTEAVSERLKPITLRVGVFDGEQPVTNVETITFDSSSSDMNEWEKPIRLTLENRQFHKSKTYQLILRNQETGVDEARFDVSIDLAFSNDF